MKHPHKDTKGRWLTQALIWEKSRTRDKFEPHFTIADPPREGLKPFKETFLSTDDPTGYFFAVEHLGGWEHFQFLMNIEWFAALIEECKEEMELRAKAQSIRTIIRDATSTSKTAPQNAKWLHMHGITSKSKGKKEEEEEEVPAHMAHIMSMKAKRK